MTAPQEATAEDLTEQLDALATHLERLGLRTRTLPGHFAHLSEIIYAANGHQSGAAFWWSWCEPIGAITTAEAVAARIARVLA